MKNIQKRNRSRQWYFIIEDNTFLDLLQLISLKVRYMIFKLEKNNDIDSIYGYILFDQPRDYSSIHKKIKHAEIKDGNFTEFERQSFLISNSYYEFGEIKHQGMKLKSKHII